ncbi:pyruvate, phosphate dikinase [Acidaminobacter hydrogenoformans]|uniref:Pyruvate, phosphate dikinase n=1 Tax=Acidaminobacter hydrogenoformans DSM 2784 TaxID=1120920 RepID=A0A1G5RT29_9FIRM|nr:pyruvate, phosphate dikinase [Acidaminobacter hydrogenoformans]SCZ77146.1 pyruvate phosphate dikinase [Acidaminobacter hydrogenoformans DSM 2784]
MKKWVYFFEEGNANMKALLGGKGANLAEMKRIGLPVPNGFTITTEACNAYYENGKNLGEEVNSQIFEYLKKLEGITGKTFGSKENPLLVSVRSGSVFSMPGMMDTILNLGLNDDTVEGLAALTENPRFAYDSYRRFIQMFSDVVLKVAKYNFEHALEAAKRNNGLTYDTDLTVDHLKALVKTYKDIVMKETRKPFPQEPEIQLIMAVNSVFESWDNPRANIYRNLNDIAHNLGTAVNIQEMVFGNMGDTSGTGVAFTRNPSTGDSAFFGEFLLNAQGEDVVAGIRTPKPISELKEIMPEVYKQFIEISKKLETHYKDMQDIEFTIERGKLFMLQTRNGKRTAPAAVNIAVDLVEEGLIDEETAIMRLEPDQIDQLLHPTFDEVDLANAKEIAKGLPASPGAACGQVFFSAEDVVAAQAKGIPAMLVRQETSPEDIEGMVSCVGILTSRGGMTSHAAVVARGMGKCCVAGCGEIKVEEYAKQFHVDGLVVKEGDYISLDGNNGRVFLGKIRTKEVELTGNFGKLMAWADVHRVLKVRTNADNPRDSKVAVKFGAEGIGLCRTEHMFFEEERIPVVRRMIVAKTIEARKEALDLLLPFQRADFIGIFEAMGERPVTIRLLDPPLHEFLPHEDKDIEALAKDMKISAAELKSIVNDLKEFNPMLGHRGCRLAITYPEIYQMQVRAIFEAVVDVVKRLDLKVKPEVMIPLVGFEKELEILAPLVRKTANEVLEEHGLQIDYKVGTMIEVPRAALLADDIAKHAEFFSFGTNDLTQMTLGFSRDDAGKFMPEYRKKEIFEKDPFQTIDQKGVGKLMKMAIELGRAQRPDIKLGICGEHGGEPKSVEFCHAIGLEYVSCSPYRVPIAKLAAAQAAIKAKNGESKTGINL